MIKLALALLAVGGGVALYRSDNKTAGNIMQQVKAAVMPGPRGIRNNNPLNIRKSADKWQGKAGDDGAFVIFDTPENGIRAAGRLLKTYRDKHGLNTIRGIVNRWAPPNENNTEAYIAFVEQKTGFFRDLTLNASDYPAVIAAMIQKENGQQPYELALITQAVSNGLA